MTETRTLRIGLMSFAHMHVASYAAVHGQAQAAPRGVAGRLAPTAVDGGDQAVGVGDEYEPAGLDVPRGVVQDPVGLCVDLDRRGVDQLADQVGEVDGVVHDRSAAGKGRVAQPLAFTEGRASVVGADRGPQRA